MSKSISLNLVSDDQLRPIYDLDGTAELVVRLMELGFTPGQEIRLTGRALFGSPVYVEVRGAVLALRKNEAECIRVAP